MITIIRNIDGVEAHYIANTRVIVAPFGSNSAWTEEINQNQFRSDTNSWGGAPPYSTGDVHCAITQKFLYRASLHKGKLAPL